MLRCAAILICQQTTNGDQLLVVCKVSINNLLLTPESCGSEAASATPHDDRRPGFLRGGCLFAKSSRELRERVEETYSPVPYTISVNSPNFHMKMVDRDFLRIYRVSLTLLPETEVP